MILKEATSDIEVIGDIKEFKTKIDPKNLDFIITLLSSNLYSAPEESFVREIVSNAWDSHVEAGTTDTPVLIIPTKNSISIRDYGTGISPERFRDIYCGIGSSTKRESNDYHGCFGIGRFSALSVKDIVYITSYYEGTEYQYILTKDGNNITFNLVYEGNTDQKNGVEVKLCDLSVTQREKITNALGKIIFFPNVYIKDTDWFNNSVIYEGKYYKAVSRICYDKILLGNVLYPIDRYKINWELRDFITSISQCGIVIKFDIGELEVTPNREQIIYNEHSIKLIEDRISFARAEFIEDLKKASSADFNNLNSFIEAFNKTSYYNVVKKSVSRSHSEGDLYMQIEFKKYFGYTYNGSTVNDSVRNYLASLIDLNIFNLRGFIVDNKFIADTSRLKNYSRVNTVIVKVAGGKCTQSVRNYLAQKYEHAVVVSDYTDEGLKNYVERNSKYFSEIPRKLFFEHLRNITETFNQTTDQDYLEYKKNNKIKKKTPVIRNPIIYEVYGAYSKHKRTYNDFESLIRDLKSYKKGILVAGMEDFYYSLLAEFATKKGWTAIVARADIVKALKTCGESFIIDADKALYSDKLLSMVKANKFKVTSNYYQFCQILNKQDIDMCNLLLSLQNNTSEIRRHANKLDIEPDSYILSESTRLMRIISDLDTLWCDLGSVIGDLKSHIGIIIAVKRKLYRPSFSYYKRAKNNKIIKELCGK